MTISIKHAGVVIRKVKKLHIAMTISMKDEDARSSKKTSRSAMLGSPGGG